MSDEPPFDPDVAALLGRERSRLDVVPEEALGRISARMDALATAGAVPTPSHPLAPPPPPSPSLPPSALARLAPVAAAFVVGVGTGAALVVGLAPPAKERVVVIEAPPSATVHIPDVTPDPPAVSVSALPTTTAPAPSVPQAKAVDSFVAERRVLDAARTELARGDAASALRSLAEHERTYPNGALAEEREALFVRSLAEEGRRGDARARADRFRARWPRSLLLPAVEAAAGAEDR